MLLKLLPHLPGANEFIMHCAQQLSSRNRIPKVSMSFLEIWLFPTDKCLPTTETYKSYLNGLVQDGNNSSALAMELLQSCTKPSTCPQWDLS